jgi:hypothetical protein
MPAEDVREDTKEQPEEQDPDEEDKHRPHQAPERVTVSEHLRLLCWFRFEAGRHKTAHALLVG